MELVKANNSSDIATIQSEVTTNTANIATINSEITTIQATQTTQTNSINTLNSEQSTNASTLTTIAGEISTLQSSVSALQSGTATSSSVTSLGITVGTNTSNISANSASIATLNGEVSTLQSTQASHSTSIATLNSEVATNTTNITNNTTSINTLNTEVGNIQTTQTSQSSSITTLQSTQSSHTTSINTINSEIASLQNGVAANAIPSTIQTSYASGDYVFAISNSGTPYKITIANLLAGVSSGSSSSSSPVWIYKNSNYTANAGDQIVTDASSGSFTITLPSSPSNGSSVTIALTKNNSSNSNIVSVVASSGLSPYASIYINIPSEITLVYLSSAWQIIGTYNGVYPVGTFPVTPRYRFSASLQSGFVNGSSVGSISDSSNNNFTGTASGTAQPVFQTNAINGYPALLFNGSTNYITLGSSQVIADPGDFVIFQVVKYSASSGVSFGGGSSASTSWGLAMEQGGDYAVAGGSQVSISLTMSLNTWYIKAFSRIGNVWKSWVNGGTGISGGTNSGALRGVSNGYESIDVIGAFWNGSASNFTNGYIAETAIISSPTLANINSIGAYYSSMYGITWSTAS